MLENTPTQSTMTELLGQPLFAVWQELCSAIDEKYDMERLWNTGGKNWVYEYSLPRMIENTRALTPELICTTFPPAKSTDPISPRKPPWPHTM